MIKEVAEILLEHFNNGFVMGEIGVGDDQKATDKALIAIINLFKAGLEKLTVIDDGEIAHSIGTDHAIHGFIVEDIDFQRAIKAQLQHTREELIGLMEE